MTRAASPPPKGKQRSVRQCPTLIAGDRDCSASILTVDPISSQVYAPLVAFRLRESARCRALPFLPRAKAQGFLGDFR